MIINIMYILFVFISNADSTESNKCINELPEFNKEIVQRIENLYSKGKTEYIFNKKEINFYISDECKNDPFVLVEAQNYLKNMGYGVHFSADEVLICQDECEEDQLNLIYQANYFLIAKKILSYIFLFYLLFFIINFFIINKKP